MHLILAGIAQARVAILLVSAAFLASTFIQEQELPRLLFKSRQRTCRVLWLVVEDCDWQTSPLQEIIALHDPAVPLATLPAAQQQDTLIQLRQSVAAALA
ncbi:hypothetical protein [Hymenobacter defluvii]|uniref:Uncharacterized protein n=1 Tax=Hymenobacter defluvii TaxID=2054411 RepID=A0ABS3THL7_9BACT|nr:hypothetical protein [Hymenobacter defluvii]MBO3273146.1 hypothetical protein [Hymenobacter defluvii]